MALRKRIFEGGSLSNLNQQRDYLMNNKDKVIK